MSERSFHGHHSQLMSCSFTIQVLAQFDLLRFWNGSTAYKHEVYFLPNRLHKKVVSLHLPALMVALSVFTCWTTLPEW